MSSHPIGSRLARIAHAAGAVTVVTALAPTLAHAQAARASESPPADEKLQTAADMIHADARGITADEVGRRAAETSYSAKAAEEQLRSAAARVDAAWVSFLPRLSGTASYTRLSNLTPPNLFGGGGGFLVGTPVAPTVNPATGQPNPIAGPFVSVDLSKSAVFPVIVDNYLLQGTITVPISDYFLRINQNYTAVTRSSDAARFDAAAAKAKAASDGKGAFYTWLRARGSQRVTEAALEDQKTHLADAKNQFAAGSASRADVLRAETGVAQAELQVEHAKNLAQLAETQVRVAIHAPDGEALVPGESLEGQAAPVQGSVQELTQEALTSRLEVRSVDANTEAALEQAKVVHAGYYPQVAAFGDAIYANPNQRLIPPTQEWFPSWDLGARLTWSPNDALTASPQAKDAEARAAALTAQRGVVRDGITIEVTQAWQAVREADLAIDTTKREVVSATEAHRVARELFNAGRATSATLTDAETELTRARLDALNAAVDARVARVQLDHALGRDAPRVIAER